MGLVRAPDERFEDLPGYDYEASYVDVGDGDGPEMAYVDEGSGEETFLCLHGEPTWSYLYRKMIPTLSNAGRVVVPDLVGFGRSDKFTDREDYTYSTLYDQVETFVTELDLQDVTLVCQDWGGLLGLPVAANNPERFARLVPMNTGMMDGTQEMPQIWHDFKDMMAETPELQVSRVVDGGCLTDLDEDVLAAYDAPFPDEQHRAGARELPGIVPIDPEMDGAETMQHAREQFRDWDKPVFVLFSDSDPITHGARDDLRELFPTAEEQPDTWIEGAAHFLQEEKGEEIAEEIVEFVERT